MKAQAKGEEATLIMIKDVMEVDILFILNWTAE